MTPVRFAPEVLDELAEAVLWYEARRRGLAVRVVRDRDLAFDVDTADDLAQLDFAALPTGP